MSNPIITNGHHHIDALHEAAEAGGLEEDIGSFLFSSESVGEGHPGKYIYIIYSISIIIIRITLTLIIIID